jgi:hypothetical protein
VLEEVNRSTVMEWDEEMVGEVGVKVSPERQVLRRKQCLVARRTASVFYVGKRGGKGMYAASRNVGSVARKGDCR